MNRLYVIVSKFIILFAMLLMSCATTARLEDFGNLDSVYEIKLKKNIIYDRIMIFIATKYVSPKTVMQYNSKDQGIITFNGVIDNWYQSGQPMYSYCLNYKITINIKDNKYKIKAIPLSYVFNTTQGLTGFPILEMVPDYVKEFNKIKLDIVRFVNGETCDDF